MVGLELVRPLDDDWRDTLDAVAASRGWPSTREPRKLAARVAELSAAYNDGARAGSRMHESGAARLGFSFARDVPKGAAAVREIIASRALPGTAGGGAVVRVLDVGAGLGAMTWGVARALDAAGLRVRVDATWLDADAAALDVARALVAARRSRAGGVELSVQAVVADVDPRAPARHDRTFDLILAGQLLSEMDVGVPDDERAELHAAWLATRMGALAEGGFLVVVEPALRDRTRHLHRVRDTLLAQGAPVRAAVFAPCLHRASCPALEHPGDWCHEDLPIDLPAWLVPIARGAGLRFQGLTFSYLVLRRPGQPTLATLAAAAHSGGSAVHLRVVSNRRVKKGKVEAFLCGSSGDAGEGARSCVDRLDRDEAAANRAWGSVQRGDVVTIDPAPRGGDEREGGERVRLRVRKETRVALLADADLGRSSGVGESR
ncbi:MAG: small ribosomal subunit Rsm22 family protein [Polyangiaceae bacterium]|nr:small ribosomal subunit Rsm22 family protein [Polyangiaceae bacterium]